MMKNLTAILLACAMAGSLSACGTGGAPSAPTHSLNQDQGSQPPKSSPTTEPAPAQSDEGGKALVVYYSATGSTGAVAETIAGLLEADTFEITPKEPYTADDLNWTEDGSRVNAEHDDPSLRTVELISTTVDGWDSYDTVFIGYPIWWGIAAWPVDSFVAANDFSGKTVIPFCTSTSSGMGESGALLTELAGTGDWLEGQRFRGGADKADVSEWVDGLDLAQ